MKQKCHMTTLWITGNFQLVFKDIPTHEITEEDFLVQKVA